MSTNFYFNNFKNFSEQGLLDDLVVESIAMYGIDVYYVPRSVLDENKLLTEPSRVLFGAALPLAMHVKNVEGFEGEGDFLSKFGLQIRDAITMSMARRSFAKRVSSQRSDLQRPREGDLVWFPLNRKLFVIKFVEHEPTFYQLGSQYFYDLKLELFEYNNESFDTGIPDVDQLYAEAKQNIGSVDPDTVDVEDFNPLALNREIETQADQVVNFDEDDPFAEGTRY